MDISKIDKNFSLHCVSDKEDIVWHDIRDKEFAVYGLYNPFTSDEFIRIPKEIANTISEEMTGLNTHTAGARIRFKTDSPYIAIAVDMPNTGIMSHMTIAGSKGFDIYCDNGGKSSYHATMMPSFDSKGGFNSIVPTYCKNEPIGFTINFPLYHSVTNLYIGLKEGAKILPPDDYALNLPVVFYGSSITQGGCASRPGNCYVSMISRDLNIDYINLGFSGNCKGEESICEYMSTLKMSAFVSDYDHNAPTPEHLEETHFRLYEIIRKKSPDIPYIMVSRPNNSADCDKRFEIIKASFEKAKAKGDMNVYLVDGREFFDGEHSCDCTVDGCHPNDLGFYRMATVLGKVLKEVLF